MKRNDHQSLVVSSLRTIERKIQTGVLYFIVAFTLKYLEEDTSQGFTPEEKQDVVKIIQLTLFNKNETV